MEQNAPDSLFDLQVDYDSGNFLKETSKWTKFIAIASFIAIGFFLLALLVSGSFIMTAIGTGMPAFAGLGGLFIGIMVIVLAIVAFLVIQLYQFAIFTRRGIEAQDQVIFNKGLKALKNYFIIYGVLVILGLIANFFELVSKFF